MTHTMFVYEVKISFMRICPRKPVLSLAELDRDKGPAAAGLTTVPNHFGHQEMETEVNVVSWWLQFMNQSPRLGHLCSKFTYVPQSVPGRKLRSVYFADLEKTTALALHCPVL